MNLFVASALCWEKEGFQMETITDFPYESDVRFRILQNKGRIATLKIRIPRWAKEVGVKVNGKTIKYKNRDGYLKLERICAELFRKVCFLLRACFVSRKIGK